MVHAATKGRAAQRRTRTSRRSRASCARTPRPDGRECRARDVGSAWPRRGGPHSPPGSHPRRAPGARGRPRPTRRPRPNARTRPPPRRPDPPPGGWQPTEGVPDSNRPRGQRLAVATRHPARLTRPGGPRAGGARRAGGPVTAHQREYTGAVVPDRRPATTSTTRPACTIGGVDGGGEQHLARRQQLDQGSGPVGVELGEHVVEEQDGEARSGRPGHSSWVARRMARATQRCSPCETCVRVRAGR